MTGDRHVQFCEGLWVKLPRSTLSLDGPLILVRLVLQEIDGKESAGK
jgi:hypothetical protein